MTTRPINLHQARKTRARADAKRQADENAIRHGLSKAERMRQVTTDEKLRAHLDGHRFEDE